MNHGTVKLNDKILKLTQDAYLTGTYNDPHYEARAVDDEGNEYMVTWIVYDNWQEDALEADECCDWDDYKIEKIA